MMVMTLVESSGVDTITQDKQTMTHAKGTFDVKSFTPGNQAIDYVRGACPC